MTDLLSLLGAALWGTPTSANRVDGLATQRAGDLLQATALARGMDLANHVDGVALNRKADLGRQVWLEWPHLHGIADHIHGPFLVVDHATQENFRSREEHRRIVEVSSAYAAQNRFWRVDTMPVVLWFEDPRLELHS